ncbi:hypothetical protein BC826DRAFT_1089411 [Russula brevipes]|nr:hypothetical protein BC826DRAFT_1089411 [Russula brevipes]
MPASIFGVLARLGLQALANYNGKSYGPLYTAITTGFCGSLTTFSGWQLDIFYSWINEGQFHRGWLRDAVDGISKLFFTLLISLASLTLGVHIGVTLLPFIPKMRPPSTFLRLTISAVSVLVYFASFPTYFRLSASFRHQATAALLFSFPGTLTRYVLSVTLNPRSKLLPIGTLVANEFGTSLLALFHTLQGLKHPVSPGACSILQGLEDGYCGCLTTVRTLAGWRRWLYGTISIVMAQVLIVLILGSTLWKGVASAQISCELI